MLRGIDISNHNWDYLSGRNFADLNNVSFVLMKASEGATFKDPHLDEYYNILHGSGDGRPDPDRLYGFYHYARPELNDPLIEAAKFYSLVAHHSGHAIFALDVEGKALSLPPDHLDHWVNLWCSYIAAWTGVRPLVYCSLSQAHIFKDTAAGNFGLWVASWGSKKPTKKSVSPWPFWAFWQDSTSGGFLDTDYFNGSEDQYRKYCEVH